MEEQEREYTSILICPNGSIRYYSVVRTIIYYESRLEGDFEEVEREEGDSDELVCTGLDVSPYEVEIEYDLAKKIIEAKDNDERLEILLDALEKCKAKIYYINYFLEDMKHYNRELYELSLIHI